MKIKFNKILYVLCLILFVLGLGNAAVADDSTGAMMINPGIGTGRGMNTEVSNLHGYSVVSDRTKCYPATKLAEYNKDDCTLCPIFRVVFNTASKVAAKSSNSFSKPVISVVLAAFAVWLVIYILKYLSSMETKDAKDLFQEVIIKGFQVVIVVCILNVGASNFYSWLINPVYETALEGGQMAFEDNNATVSKGVEFVAEGLPTSMGNAILKSMMTIENNLMGVRAFGSSLMCYSWEQRRLLIIPNFSLLFSGVFFWLMAIVMIIAIPLLLVDAVFQLSVAVALLPAAIGCYPFRPTRQYSKKVWDTFLNSALAFLFVSVVVVLLLGVLEATIEGLITESNAETGKSFTWEQIKTDTTGRMDEYVAAFGWFHNHVMKFLLVFVLAWALMSKGKEFADEFASSISSTQIGNSIGTMAASAVKGMGQKALTPVKEGAASWAKDKAASVGQHLGHFHQRQKGKREQRRFERNFKKYGGTTSVDQDGQQVESFTRNRKFLGMGMGGIFGTKTFTRDATGNITVDKTRGFLGNWGQKLRTKVVVRTKDGARVENAKVVIRKERVGNDYFVTERTIKVFSGVKVYDDGSRKNFSEEKVIDEKVIVKAAQAEDLRKENGELDMAKISGMMQGMNDKQKLELQKQIAHKLAEDDLEGLSGNSGVKSVKTEVVGDVVRTIKIFRGGRKEITEVKFPLKASLDQRAALINRGAEKVYDAAQLQKYLDEQQKALNGSDQANNFANIHEFAKEDLQDFVNGKLAITQDAYGKMSEFIETFSGGYAHDEEMQKLHDAAMKKLAAMTENNNRVEVTRVIIRNNGKVTKLSTDGLYNRIDSFKLEDANMISNVNSISEVEEQATKDSYGKIKCKTSIREGNYSDYVRNPELESNILPQEHSVKGFFGGVWADMNDNGEFVDRETGAKVAEKSFITTDDGEKHQVYLNRIGEEFIVQDHMEKDLEGNDVKVKRRLYIKADGTKQWGDKVDSQPLRELIIEYGSDGIPHRRMMKEGIISDVMGMRVYGEVKPNEFFDADFKDDRHDVYFKKMNKR